MREKLKTKTSIVATVFDSAPPRRWLAALVAAPFIAAAVLGLVSIPIANMTFLAALVGLLAFDLRRRRGPRQVNIACEAGALRGTRMATIRARHIVGATTARHDGRVSLVLTHARRKNNPIILDLPDDDALASVSKSLGIGHHGFGQVGAVLDPSALETIRYASALILMPIVIAGLVVSEYSFVEVVRSLLTFGILAWLVGHLIRALKVRPKLVLTQFGLGLPAQHAGLPVVAGCTFVPFDAIEKVELQKRALLVTIRVPSGLRALSVPVSPSRWVRLGVSNGEALHLASQIQAAADRAHGHFVVKREPGSLVEQLKRVPNESLRDWLARIDTLGVGGPGYRTVEIDSNELWSILEDPEAAADLRSAAARLLKRSDPDRLRTRVAEVLEAERDPHVRKRIASSVDEDALEKEERDEARALVKHA